MQKYVCKVLHGNIYKLEIFKKIFYQILIFAQLIIQKSHLKAKKIIKIRYH